jgi:hypothetical protein
MGQRWMVKQRVTPACLDEIVQELRGDEIAEHVQPSKGRGMAKANLRPPTEYDGKHGEHHDRRQLNYTIAFQTE